MSTSYASVHVKCPFYIKDERNMIVCEGFGGSSRVTQQFGKKEQKEAFLKKCCCGKYEECQMHGLIENKY